MDDAREKTLDTIAVAGLIALWAVTIASLPGLPDMIATSFSNDGSPRMYDSKYILFLMPAIGAFTWGIVWLVLRLQQPQLNVPFFVPADRLPALATMSRFYQRVLRAELLVGFTALQWTIIESARIDHLASGFPAVLAAFIVTILSTVGFMLYRTWRVARGQ